MSEQTSTTQNTTQAEQSQDTSANTQPQSSEQNATDYKALYETMKADRDKLKGLNDKYTSQLSDYKKEKTATMTESERLTEELETQRQTAADLQERIARIQSEKVFADKGFKPDEYSPIIETIATFGAVTEENSIKLSQQITEIIDKRVANEKQLYENSMTANNTVQTNASSNTTHDIFSSFREQDRKNRETQKQKLNI